MTCTEARHLLLTADAADVRPGAATVLREHLDACIGCRALADRVVAVEDALRAVRALPLRHAPSDIAARAVAAGRRARVIRRRILWSAGPALAAALVVAALLTWSPSGPGPTVPVAERPTAPPLVVASSGDVAIITTANPHIVVVWQF
jgi:predicted anti-sigma-YlaC factor YlaD